MNWLVIILVLVIVFVMAVMLRAALGPDYDKEPDDALDRMLDDDNG